MRIVNRREFLKLPSGTVYCNFNEKSYSFDGFSIKLDFLENDWYYQDLTDFDNWDNSIERIEKIDFMKQSGEDIPLLLDSSARDGMFEDEDMFCIYTKSDVKRIVEVLIEVFE